MSPTIRALAGVLSAWVLAGCAGPGSSKAQIPPPSTDRNAEIFSDCQRRAGREGTAVRFVRDPGGGYYLDGPMTITSRIAGCMGFYGGSAPAR